MEITMNADWSKKLQWQQSGRQKALSWGFCLNISNQDVIMQSQQKGFFPGTKNIIEDDE